jgi:Ca2+-binding RTX toxin-like protein/uncharacterized protein YegL
VGTDITFTPDADYNGPASFTYTITDADGDSSTATVNLTVTSVNDSPVVTTDSFSVDEGTVSFLGNVLTNDTDADGDTLTVGQFAVDVSGAGATTANGVNTITTAAGGTVVMNTDGTYTYTAPVLNHPVPGVTDDSFAYRANDGTDDSAWTTVNIDITDTVPVANDDVDSLSSGSPLSGNVITGLTTAGLGAADAIGADATDITNVVLTQGTLVSNTVGGGNVRTIVTSNGTLVIDQDDGSYTYTAVTPVTKTITAGTNSNNQGVWTANGIDTYGYDNAGTFLADPYAGGTPASGLGVFGTIFTTDQESIVTYRNRGGTTSDGLGVRDTGGSSRIESNEHLLLDLNMNTQSANVTLTNLGAGETANWNVFAADGSHVGSGSINGNGSNVAISNISVPGESFEYIVFTTTGGTNYRIDGISTTSVIDTADVFTYTLTDADGDTSSATLTINPGDGPVIDLDADNSSLVMGSGYASTFNGGGGAISVVDTDISITDADSTNITGATITLNNMLAGDVLSAGVMPSGIFASVAGNVVTLSGTATLADYQAAIQAITFDTTSGDATPRTIDVVVTDGVNTSNTATTTINLVLTGPVLDLDADDSTDAGSDYIASYTEGGAAVSIADADISITDVDSTNLAGATITLTNAQVGDLLAAGTLPGGITASAYNSGTGEITLSGSASLADYQAAIQAITFENSTNNPGATPRVINVTLTDGVNVGNTAVATVNVTPINEAPIANADTAAPTDEGATTIQSSVLVNDTDGEGEPLVVSLVATNTGGAFASVANGVNTITTALGGTVVMNADGTYTYTAPASDHSGGTPVDSFAYKANDGTDDSAWTTVTIDITDTAPVANDDVDSVALGSAVTGNVITGEGGITADTLNVDAPITMTNVTLTQGTEVSSTTTAPGETTVVTENGTLVIQDDGSYTYTQIVPADIVVSTQTGSGGLTSFTDAGFTLYGFDASSPYTGAVGGNLDLTTLTGASGIAAQARVIYTNNTGTQNDGLGVEENAPADDFEGQITDGEQLVIDLGVSSKVVTLNLDDFENGNTAFWEAYDASGTLVASGSTTRAGGGSEGDVVISSGTAFDYVVLRSTGNWFRLDGMTVTPEPSTVPDIFTYTITDNDGDSSSATLTMNIDVTTTAVVDVATVNEAGLNETATQDGGTLAATSAEVATGNLLANDTGISANTEIINVNGNTPTGGVITITDAISTTRIYTQDTGGFVKGDYVVTLTGNTTEGVDDTLTFTYNLENSVTLEADSATLTVNILDDAPIAKDAIVQVQEGLIPNTNLVFVIDVSGSMAGETKNVAPDGTVTIIDRLDATKIAVNAVIDEYFNQGGNVSIKLVSFQSTATLLNGGSAYTTAAAAKAAVNALTDGGGTNYEDGLFEAMGAFSSGGDTLNTAENNSIYFISDGVPTSGDTTDPGASNGYHAFVNGNGIKSYAVGIGTGIANPAELNNIHNIDSDNSGTKDPAIIVTNVATLDDVLLASVPTSFGGSVAGNATNSSLLFGADGGYISELTMRLDTDANTVPDTDVTFSYNVSADEITVVGGFPAAGFPLSGSLLTLDASNGFVEGILVLDFATGAYTYQTAGLAAEGDEFDINFIATDGDGDMASGKQTIQIVDGQPKANNDIDTLVGNTSSFEGNVISGIGTDGGDNLQLTSFSTGRSGEDNPGDDGAVSSIVFKGVTFDLTSASTGSALAGTYSVAVIGGVNTLTWTATTGGSSLVFNTEGYYKYSPPTAEISTNVTGPATNYLLTSAGLVATAQAAGMTLRGVARNSSLEGSPGTNISASGVGVTGNNNTRVDALESLVITFNAAQHPHGVQNVSIDLNNGESNLGGTLALNYSVYNVHGRLLGQFSSNSENPIPMGFAGIGKIVIDSGGFGNPYGTLEDVTYSTILDTAGSVAPPPEVINYTITDADGDTSSATLTLNNIIDDIAGTSANNTINGSARNESISGFAGDDTINAGAGFDIVRGGDGNDVIDGGADADQLYGNAGNDAISGGTGADLIYGDAGNDTLNGQDGNDIVFGGAGNDTIDGGAGADTLSGGAGNDNLTGGVGVDVFKWSLGDEGIVGSPAADVITDFDPAAAGAGGDVLDLRDLLVGEEQGVGAGNLASYLHFEVVGSDTVIHVSSNGGYSNGFSTTQDVQTITLTGVDLVTGFTNDAQVIQDLLANNKLIVD